MFFVGTPCLKEGKRAVGTYADGPFAFGFLFRGARPGRYGEEDSMKP